MWLFRRPIQKGFSKLITCNRILEKIQKKNPFPIPLHHTNAISYDLIIRSYGWSTVVLDAGNTSYNVVIDNLNPNTQYAYYVTTRVENVYVRDYILDVTQGLSEIDYFTTDFERPSQPRVRIVEKKADSLTFQWLSWITDYESIAFYYVDIFVQPDIDIFNDRNYCEHPHEDMTVTFGQFISEDTSSCLGSKLPPGYSDKIFDEYGNRIKQNISVADMAEWRYLRHIECSLWQERHSFDHQISIYMKSNMNQFCGSGDTHCDFANHFPDSTDYINGSDASFFEDVKNTPYHIGNRSMSSDEETFTVQGLAPFTLYTMHFFSCNRNLVCGPYYLHSERTAINPNADNVTLLIEQDDDTRNTVHLYIKKPEQPNGLTVAFVIEHHDMNQVQSTETCISAKEIANMNNK